MRAVELILAVGILLSSLELLHIRHEFRDDGWLSWRVHRLSHPRMTRFISELGAERLFRYPGVLLLLTSRILAAIILIVMIVRGRSCLPALVTLAVTALLITLRCPQSNDGADQMSLIAVTTAALAEMVGTNTGIKVGLGFLAAQSALAYMTSGILKVREVRWRNGDFVTDILKTSTFGNLTVLRLVERRVWLAAVLGYSIALGDCVVGCAAVLPPDGCIAVLLFGLSMHVGIAAILGLNTFLWSFAGTYPAVLWVSATLYSGSLH